MPSQPIDHEPQHGANARRRAWYACAVIAATLLTLVVIGHDGRRVAQLMALALPPIAWLAWPVRSDRVHRARALLVWLWVMAFAIDGATRAYLYDAYGAAPDGSMVLGAAANTSAQESSEYFFMHWRSFVAWGGGLALASWLAARHARRGLRASAGVVLHSGWNRAGWSRPVVLALASLMLVGSLAYASKPWRRLHPVVFWSTWAESVADLRAGWANQAGLRQMLNERARAEAPAITRDAPSTVMLVIGESINRDDLGLYGYGRDTTPQLSALKAQLGDSLVVLRNAWSLDASTLPALSRVFRMGEPQRPDSHHLLALARAAGYKIWWISNHDDLAIEQQHALFADVVSMRNRTPGRASESLDSALLGDARSALADVSPRKLIVVHTMGAHPHYALRYPAGANPFDDANDAVDARMAAQGRSSWVREFRQDYDAAVLFHDDVLSALLRMTRDNAKPGEHRAWMYFSDHGQEVGHTSDHAGHSPTTPSGYRIPALVWRGAGSPRVGPPWPADVESRPFRSDWAGFTLLELLDVHWAREPVGRDVLATDYAWQPPKLPIAIESFTR